MVELHPERKDCGISERVFYVRDALPDPIQFRPRINETSGERLGADSSPTRQRSALQSRRVAAPVRVACRCHGLQALRQRFALL